MTVRRFTAAPKVDPRNRDYLSRDVIARQDDVRKVWQAGPRLDQGETSECMAFGWTGELLARPMGDVDATSRQGNTYAHAYHRRALELGSAEAVAVEAGLIAEYRWASDLDDVRDALIAEGPVVVYVPWYLSMGNVNSYGRLRVNPASGDYGYHCVFLRGYDPAKQLGKNLTGPAFLLRNSWGRWGHNGSGDAWLTAGDLDTLLTAESYQSCACVPMGRRPVNIEDLLAHQPA